MYNLSFGLRRNPFNMTPDPAFLFLTPQHREALVGLTYAILQRKGFVVLTGQAGTGKTTLLARVLQFLPGSRLQFSLVTNPTLTPSEFLELALLDFGLTEIPASKAQRLWKLQKLILDGHHKGRVSALVVDEAHKLSPEVLEEIRLLGNFEDADQKLLQILLVGQTELNDVLNRQDLRQLKQRIGVRLVIGPLSTSDVSQYIRHRWVVAGGTHPPFTAQAVAGIAAASGAIPRLVNSLCDNALTIAFAEGVKEVQARHVQMAAADLQLADPAAHSQPGPMIVQATTAPMIVEVTPPTEGPAPEPVNAFSSSTSKLLNGSASKSSMWSKWRERLGIAPGDEATQE